VEFLKQNESVFQVEDCHDENLLLDQSTLIDYETIISFAY